MKFNKCLIVLLVLAIFLSINLACASDVNSTDVSHVGADDAISVNDVSYSNLDSSSFNNVNSVYDFENAMNEAHCAHVSLLYQFPQFVLLTTIQLILVLKLIIRV